MPRTIFVVSPIPERKKISTLTTIGGIAANQLPNPNSSIAKAINGDIIATILVIICFLVNSIIPKNIRFMKMYRVTSAP